MTANLGRYEFILRSTQGDRREFIVGEFTLDVRPGEDGVVDFYDVTHELEDTFGRVFEVPPARNE